MKLRRSRRREPPVTAAHLALSLLCVGVVLYPMLGEAAGKSSILEWGPQQVGVALGYGQGVKFGNSGAIQGHLVEELILLAHWQIDITRAPVSNGWARGRTSFRAEGTYFRTFEPHSGNTGGLALLLRYNFLYLDRLQPFIQAGAGFLSIDLDLADQADGFAFQPQGAVGVVYKLDPSHSVEGAWRFHHISNAHTQRPNGGIDTSQFILGYAYHF